MDWYRRSLWQPEDKHDFFTRLSRTRKSSRSQYLRIQASYLQEAGLYLQAIELLSQMLNEYPDRTQLAPCHLQLAQCHLALGLDNDAVRWFRTCLDFEREWPSVRTDAWLEFPWYIVTSDHRELYSEAQEVLDEFSGTGATQFPIHIYRENAVRAIITAERGDTFKAKSYAIRALSAASTSHSGLRYHPNLGLVQENQVNRGIYLKLKELTG